MVLHADVALVTEARYQSPTVIAGPAVASSSGRATPTLDRRAPIASGEGEAPPGYVDNIFEEDRLLTAALGRHGLTALRVDWARDDVDWARFRCAVLRTPWDYPDRFAAFTAWIDRVAAATRLINPRELVLWNLDKHYLGDLRARGVAVVPTRYLEAGTGCSLFELCDQEGWDEVVIKPALGAAARDTHRIHHRDAAAHQRQLDELTARGCMMVQEFQRDVVDRGETTLVVLGGVYSHAVLKVARPGDFRVQDDYGGSLHDYQPSEDEIQFAERAVAACDEAAPVYARVDVIRDNAGQLAVMELELVEPELWFRRHPPAATTVADRLAALLEPG